MRTFSAFLSLLPFALSAEILPDGRRAAKLFQDDTYEPADKSVAQTSNREDRFLSLFQIVKFNNGVCDASDGTHGVCFTEAECAAKGGVATGSCAQTYGVCCTFKASTCGSTVGQLVSYIESPNYPNPAPMGMCMFNIAKCDSNVCQYKIQFEDVMLGAPSMGECSNDTLTITNLDAVSSVVPTNLCGTMSGQEIYVTVNDTTVDPKFTFNIASNAAKWRIKVTQISCADEDKLAPPGCLTYATGTSGTIMSFNNQNGNGELLTNAKYSHCIKYQQGFCDVSFTASDFMLGTGDMIAFGTNVQTGTTFGTAGSLTYNFTGPYVFPVMIGSDNMAMNSGYSLSYLLLPC